MREFVTGIDGKNHALLTVVCLAAVHPDRVCVFDFQYGDWEVVGI